MYIGDKTVNKIYLGNTEVSKAYLGGTQVYPDEPELPCYYITQRNGRTVDYLPGYTGVPQTHTFDHNSVEFYTATVEVFNGYIHVISAIGMDTVEDVTLRAGDDPLVIISYDGTKALNISYQTEILNYLGVPEITGNLCVFNEVDI